MKDVFSVWSPALFLYFLSQGEMICQEKTDDGRAGQETVSNCVLSHTQTNTTLLCFCLLYAGVQQLSKNTEDKSISYKIKIFYSISDICVLDLD